MTLWDDKGDNRRDPWGRSERPPRDFQAYPFQAFRYGVTLAFGSVLCIFQNTIWKHLPQIPWFWSSQAQCQAHRGHLTCACQWGMKEWMVWRSLAQQASRLIISAASAPSPRRPAPSRRPAHGYWMNSWVRQEVEAPYPYLTDDETNTENIIPWLVIQLTRRTAENRGVALTMILQPPNTCFILLDTDLFFFFRRISISRPTLKVCLCHVIK